MTTEQTAEQAQQTEGTSEYEREPVPEKARLGFKSFVGMYAGEHCAGTELMLGPLFVAAGVSAFDLIVGLLLGNALAVLSWMFMCAPIATRVRLTLYYQLEKICGRNLVTVYNLANGVMFCFLAGAMITVSATAIGVWFKFPMPGLGDMYPNSAGWVIAVAVVGALISVVAAFGYNMVSKFANIAAPWMVLVFLAFGLVGFKKFIDVTGSEIHSLSDLWTLCSTQIWKGGEPIEGQVKFTFWHVMFFGWFCNMAMHIGMSDLSVFRFARKSWQAAATGSGMYVGHFMAWIAASSLYAYQLHMDSTNTDVLPGPMAFEAAGLVGLLCVIIAGWTTANPTIYRAGLAFQAIMPKCSRFKVTLMTGAIATVAGMFPAFAMKLLDFVAFYGLLLMPMGAVIFIDFWLIKKFGMQSNYAEKSGRMFNLAAFTAWIVTVLISMIFVKLSWILDKCVEWKLCEMTERLQEIKETYTIQIYFVSLPGWFLAAALYIVVSKFYQKKIRPAVQ